MRPSAAVAIVAVILWALGSAPSLAQPQPVAPVASADRAGGRTRRQDGGGQRQGPSWLKADARVCLEFPNDAQVVECSENYR